jgi:gas vesicle protein
MAGIEGTGEQYDTPTLDKSLQEIVRSLREKHSPEEVDAILATVERERKEVAEILEKEGGDVDDVIARVRRRTYEDKERLMKEIEDEMTGQSKKS